MAIVAVRDVAEAARRSPRDGAGIQASLEQPKGVTLQLSQPAHERCPKRRDSTRAADDHGDAVDERLVAGAGVGVGRDVRDAAAHPTADS